MLLTSQGGESEAAAYKIMEYSWMNESVIRLFVQTKTMNNDKWVTSVEPDNKAQECTNSGPH